MNRWSNYIAWGYLTAFHLSAQSKSDTDIQPPAIAREFRAAWIATVYNIDWPSKKGLSETDQKIEAVAILDKLVALKMNAAILQVRPHADAIYASKYEPWSMWLTGTMGKSPGYDPLAYWIEEAHARGIELHAWFNPFRALSNKDHEVSVDHISKSKPHLIRPYGNMLWADPSHPDTRAQAMTAILDVVRRYDVDGIHLDDYFYPYPSGKLIFNDGKTPADRRAIIDNFISHLYQSVKKEKPWVRVGISPFGIWRPGVPEGIEAAVDSYEHLAGDSRKWLKNGWVDYLAPQLYWRIEPKKQSFTTLLNWWREQGDRPVWPGIATTRIDSLEDPGRPSSEIIRQIEISRAGYTHAIGHIHWSVKGLMKNQGGITPELTKLYSHQAAVPAMPWLSDTIPAAPTAVATIHGDLIKIEWNAENAAKIAVQARIGNTWQTVAIVPSKLKTLSLPKVLSVAISSIDRYGNSSPPIMLTLTD